MVELALDSKVQSGTTEQINGTKEDNALGGTVFAGLGDEAAKLVSPDMFQGYKWDFDQRTNDTQEIQNKDSAYEVAEHLLWAPRKIRVASIGAGASGIMLCYKKEKEFNDDIDLVVYERYPECGGVWYANRYPGCRCDVPSPAYQYSFAPSAEWPKFYSSASDIKNYYHGFAEKQGYLEKYIKLNHEIKSATWQENKGTWLLEIKQTLSNGYINEFTDEVHCLIANYGILNTWRWPNIPDRESFEGTLVHSANYDASIDLRGKKVAIIGSGSSSIQIVPEVAKQAESTVLFYRTPQWITGGFTLEGYTDEEGRNFEFSEEQKNKFRDDPEYYLRFRKAMEDKINGSFRVMLQDHPYQKLGRFATEKRMKEVLQGHPQLIHRLVPDFAMGCRRMGPAEGFLESIVDGRTILANGEITNFTRTGIRTSLGEDIDVDVIICATGFDVSFKPYFQIIGRNGVDLAEHWSEEANAYFALAAAGFPNFMFGSLGPNCPAGHGSFVTVLEAAQNYICKVIRKLQTENIKSIDVKEEVVAEYNLHVHEWLKRTVWAAGCRSWFNQGRADGKITAQYPGSLLHCRKILEEPRYEDFNIGYRSPNRFQFMGNGFTFDEVSGKDLSWYLNPEFIAQPLFHH